MNTGNRGLGRLAWLAAWAGAVSVLAGACTEVKPFDYTEIHEIQPGPGLLTGQSGEFVLIGK